MLTYHHGLTEPAQLLGKAVEIPAHSDLWMSGARFGTVNHWRHGVVGQSDYALVRMSNPRVRKCFKLWRFDLPFAKVEMSEAELEAVARAAGWFPTREAHVIFKDGPLGRVCRHLRSGERYNEEVDSLISSPLRHAANWHEAIKIDAESKAGVYNGARCFHSYLTRQAAKES